MKEDLYITLVHKNLSGDISSSEKETLEEWLQASPDNQLIADQITKSWTLSGDFSTDIDLDLDKDFEALEKKITPTPDKKEATMTKERSIAPRRRWMSVAAGLLFLVVSGLLLRNFMGSDLPMKIVQTGPNETKVITLADGSTATLNEKTEFQYPENFQGSERKVTINGEVFFDITKNENQAFVITTPSSIVTVLGTQFSISDYQPRPNAIVTVKEGKVKLQPKGKKQSITLEKQQRGVYKKSFHKLVKNESVNLNALAWKTKKVAFDNQPLGEVFGDLLSYYGVQIYVEKSSMLQCPFTGTFDNQPFEVVLEALKGVFGFEAENIRNKSYRLRGGNCGEE